LTPISCNINRDIAAPLKGTIDMTLKEFALKKLGYFDKANPLSDKMGASPCPNIAIRRDLSFTETSIGLSR
jgi:hypothetical protein